MRRGAGRVVTAVAALLGWWLLAPPRLGGTTTYVSTQGTSMQPLFHTGDLAVIRPAGSYQVGDIVAYHSDLLHTVVMHRIVAVHDGHFSFQGDNNSWLDPEHPTVTAFLGKLALRVPHGGAWLELLTRPPAIAAVIVLLALAAAGGTAHHRRRRPRSVPMSRHTTRTTRPRSSITGGVLAGPLAAKAATLTAVAALAGLLTALAFTHRATTTVTRSEPVGGSVQFSYRAQVPPTAAYDSTTVSYPDPVFRRLTQLVTLDYNYQGPPGTATTTIALSSNNGWHTQLSTTPPAPITTSTTGSVPLDLPTLDRQAHAAAQATGVPNDQLTITLTLNIHTTNTTFSPQLHLALTPTELAPITSSGKTPTATAATETVTNTATAQVTSPQPATLGLAGHQLSIHQLRLIGPLLLLASLIAALGLLGLARWGVPPSEAARIRRRYTALLVAVEPMTAPAGRPVVDVTDFPTLARLAERYELLVLHWQRSQVATYIVHDGATTYRYRTANHNPTPETDTNSPTNEPAATGHPTPQTVRAPQRPHPETILGERSSPPPLF